MKQAISDHNEIIEPTIVNRTDVRARRASQELILRRDGVDDDGSTGTAPESSGIDAATILCSLRRNWLLGVLVGGLLAGPLAAIPWLLVKLEYKASSLVRISPQHVNLLFETADKTGSGGRADFKGYKNTQRQLILAPNHLNSVLKKDGIGELPEIRSESDPISWLQKKLEIKFPDDSEIMEVSLALIDGKSAKKIVDAVVATYYEEVVMAELDDRMKRASNLERVHAEAENKSRQKRAELQNAVDQLGSGDSSSLNLAQQSAMQQYGLIRSELTKVQFDLMRAEGETKYRQQARQNGASTSDGDNPPGRANVLPTEAGTQAIKPTIQPNSPGDDSLNQSESANPDIVFDYKLSKMIAEDPVGSHAAREVERLTKLIEQTEKRLAPGTIAPQIKKYREQLDEAKRKVSERSQLMRELLLASESGQGRSVGMLHDLPREMEILKDQERRLQEELKRQEVEAKKLGRSSIEVEMLQSDVASLDKVVERVADELERTKIELKSTSRITLLGAAQIPQDGTSKIRLPLTIGAGILGLLGPLLLLMAIDLRRRYVNGRKSVTDLALMPVLGSVPLVPKSIIHSPIGSDDEGGSVWRQRLGESVANVTSMLLHRLEFDGHRVVMVTSAMPSEGKSTLSKHLAYSIANSGRQTLLIDMDLRRPVIHRRLDLSLEPGVSDVLRKTAELDATVHQADDCPNLKILTAGKYHGTLLKDSENGRLRAMFEEARATYEIVIVDTSPLLPVTDGRLIGQYTDGAVLSVIKDVSRLPNLAEAYHIMGDYNIPVFGCVVTGDVLDSYYDYY